MNGDLKNFESKKSAPEGDKKNNTNIPIKEYYSKNGKTDAVDYQHSMDNIHGSVDIGSVNYENLVKWYKKSNGKNSQRDSKDKREEEWEKRVNRAKEILDVKVLETATRDALEKFVKQPFEEQEKQRESLELTNMVRSWRNPIVEDYQKLKDKNTGMKNVFKDHPEWMTFGHQTSIEPRMDAYETNGFKTKEAFIHSAIESKKEEYIKKVKESIGEFVDIAKGCENAMERYSFFTIFMHPEFETLDKKDQYLEKFRNYKQEVQKLQELCQRFVNNPLASEFVTRLVGSSGGVLITNDPMSGIENFALKVDEHMTELDQLSQQLVFELHNVLGGAPEK